MNCFPRKSSSVLRILMLIKFAPKYLKNGTTRDFFWWNMSGTLRVLWTQKVWAPLLSTRRPPLSGEEAGSSEPLQAGLRHEGGGLNALKQDKTGTGNPFCQLPPSHCLFSTSRVSTSETLSSWFSSKTGSSFIQQTHTQCFLCVRRCADPVINEA